MILCVATRAAPDPLFQGVDQLIPVPSTAISPVDAAGSADSDQS